jgi:hypothetical protein
VPISRGSNPHRHRLTPPTRSAKQVRQLTPPSCSDNQRAPTRERQLSLTNSPHLEPADPRIKACRSVPAQSRTATGETANEVRQVGPPTDTARFLRQSESANQRAPTAGDRLTRSATCRSSHRSVPISRGSIPHRHRRDRQQGPPTDTAKFLRQSEGASQRAPVRGRQPESANQRAPTVTEQLTPPGT